MTTGELIRQLQAADPSGVHPVCIGNAEVVCVQRLPAYYDGRLQFFVRDEKGQIVGAGYRSTGEKVSIESMSIREALWDRPDMPVDYSGCGGLEDYYRTADEEVRKEALT